MKSNDYLFLGLGIAALILIATTFYLLITVSSMAQEIQKLREDQNRTYNALMELKNKTIPSGTPIFVKISELNSNPSPYQGRLLAVAGEFHSIVTIPEIKLPYNSMLVGDSSQIGVDVGTIGNTGLEGSKVLVTGWLVQGKEKTLGDKGWVDGRTHWYLEAIEISKI